VSRALAGAGFVEVRSYPFMGEPVLDALGIPSDDERRRVVTLANPLSDEEPWLRTSLLPTLLTTARRNLGRGFPDLALFETGRVFLARAETPRAPRLGVDHRPSVEELRALDRALPEQPVHVAVVLCGTREPRGWWGSGRPADWADAVDAVRAAADALRVPVTVRAGERAPWHPGRCAEVLAGPAGAAQVVGHAGELHPKACAALGLPPGTCVAELSLDALAEHAERVPRAPTISSYPVATQDVALVVADDVPAGDVEAALVRGAGPLLESLRLFDVYEGEQVGAGHKSLAYTLRFRAPDRTLTADEASEARAAAVAEAARLVGATPRG
jgi:phenylalanyl-tRNA synthetase beta chain